MKSEDYNHFRDVVCGISFFLAFLSVFLIFLGNSKGEVWGSINGMMVFLGFLLSGKHFRKSSHRELFFVILSDALSIISALVILIFFLVTLLFGGGGQANTNFAIMCAFLCFDILSNL